MSLLIIRAILASYIANKASTPEFKKIICSEGSLDVPIAEADDYTCWGCGPDNSKNSPMHKEEIIKVDMKCFNSTEEKIREVHAASCIKSIHLDIQGMDKIETVNYCRKYWGIKDINDGSYSQISPIPEPTKSTDQLAKDYEDSMKKLVELKEKYGDDPFDPAVTENYGKKKNIPTPTSTPQKVTKECNGASREILSREWDLYECWTFCNKRFQPMRPDELVPEYMKCSGKSEYDSKKMFVDKCAEASFVPNETQHEQKRQVCKDRWAMK